MRLKPLAVLYLLLVTALAASAQTPEATPTMPPKPKETPPAAVPRYVQRYIVTTEIEANAPELKAPGGASGEAQALASQIRHQAQLVSRFLLAQDFSRQEIVSTDFVLPAGTYVQHKAGDRFYTIADPKAKTYLVMDAETLLSALEGGAGIVNSQYEAKVRHTAEPQT